MRTALSKSLTHSATCFDEFHDGEWTCITLEHNIDGLESLIAAVFINKWIFFMLFVFAWLKVQRSVPWQIPRLPLDLQSSDTALRKSSPPMEDNALPTWPPKWNVAFVGCTTASTLTFTISPCKTISLANAQQIHIKPLVSFEEHEKCGYIYTFCPDFNIFSDKVVKLTPGILLGTFKKIT